MSFDGVEANGLRTEGGDEAEIFLSSSAVDLFTLDGLELSLTLTARDNLRAETATIRFVSAPRAIESPLPIEIRLPRREAQRGMTILLAGVSGLDILHNGAAREIYMLSQSGDDLFGVDQLLGEVTARQNLDAGKYHLTLLLTHEGVTARRELRVAVLSLEEEALEAFVADIAADRIDWLGGDIDWDDDGVLNPYDWTPTSVLIEGDPIGVNLTLGGADGMAGKPWPIYNVWQLQAIDGMSVSVDNKARSGFTLFGDSQSVRLSAHYRLAVYIDARPTRDWGDKGFAPIGGEYNNESGTIEAFTGGFDGGGYAVRGLFINRPSRSFVGLFSAIESPRKMIDLGVEEADIRGQSDVGILAGSLHSGRMRSDPLRIDVRRIWTTGKVAGTPGRPVDRNSRRVGGLVGNMGGLTTISFIDLRDSWSTADVRASNVVGGLIGNIARSGTVTVSNSWAAGNVAAMNFVGGFVGSAFGQSWLTRNWSAGAVAGNSSGFSGGFLGTEGGNRGATGVTVSLSYWNADTSGVTTSQGGSVTLSVALQTLGAADFANDDSWDVGESDDFPLLTALDRPWQAVNLARALTRILVLRGEARATVDEGSVARSDLLLTLRLDTNGLAADTRANGTSAPSCSFDSGVLRAETNYNGVTVELRLLAEEAALIAAAGDCEANIESVVDEFAATLRLEIAAPAIGGDRARRLTTDYPLAIAPMFASEAIAVFLAEIASGDRKWLGGDSDDWDGDGVLNPYDWTPTSVTVFGSRTAISVNLTLGLTVEGGTKANPWPIYNIWQLQAIDGKSVSASGEIRDGLEFFGVNAAAALTLQYVLSLDIDATPTKEWKNNAGDAIVGFNPIGGDFTGYLNGNGFAVRGLFIDRSGNNIGLFRKIVKAGEVAVRNMGVEDADIRGGDQTGGFVGTNDANLDKIWTTGSVRGGDDVGGLVGRLIGQSNTVMMSWSAADVSGGDQVGGFVGFNFPTETQSVFLDDNWAAGNVEAEFSAGGFVANPVGSRFTRNWSSGAVISDSENSGGFVGVNVSPVAVYSSVYWNADTSGRANSAGGISAVVQTLTVSNFGDETAAAAWYFGDSGLSNTDSNTDGVADFPLLADLSRPWQAVNLARALTRILILEDGTRATADGRNIVRGDSLLTLRLDTNGLAADTRANGTSAPSCSFDSGVLRAETNYNGVTVELRLLAEEAALIAAAGDCEADIDNMSTNFIATLRLEIAAPAIDGDKARRLTVDYPLAVAPNFESLARAVFLAEIASGKRKWLGGDSDDWDGDGVLNPYDWTPASITIFEMALSVNLTLEDADGTAGLPWPIYNVWQLQAIDGKSVSFDGVIPDAVELTLFGDDHPQRVRAHYRLAVDIDATPTRNWDGGRGFNPIGEDSGAFLGSFDGGGHVVRGLRINRASDDYVGLFEAAFQGRPQPVRVIDLGLDDVRIAGRDNVGAIAGHWTFHAELRSVWARGIVTGRATVGGLIGGNAGDAGVDSSWFAGQVAGDSAVGGLIGTLVFAESAVLKDSWAAVDIDAPAGASELASGLGFGASQRRLWGESSLPAGSSQNDDTRSIYYDNIRSLADASFGDKWDVGTGVDFPVLVGHSRGLQGAAVASGLTRVVGIDGGASVPLTPGFSEQTLPLDFAVMRLTANTDEVDALACEFADGALRATTGYNGANVMMTVIADDWRLAYRGGCDVEWVGSSAQGVVTLRLLFVAGAGVEETRLTTDYLINIAEIAPQVLVRKALNQFVKEIEAGRVNWQDANIDWDGDGVSNPYDWTPTSVTVGREVVSVNLTLDGAAGTAGSPWPIYNVWQLQAIDGKSVSIDGVMTGGDGNADEITLFGDSDFERLNENYRLAVDIDATPTRDWDGGSGFDPIGARFTHSFVGIFDGNGRVVRGLRINRASEDFVGLFASATSDNLTSTRVIDLGLDDARIAGGNEVGAIAGRWAGGAELRSVWARGRVTGKEKVGGLVGGNIGNAGVYSSWFAGQVAGDSAVGGLAGTLSFADLEDSWAAVDIDAPVGAGELTGRVNANFSSRSRRLWGEGFSPASASQNDGARSIYYDNIRSLAASFGGKWDVGTNDDFPVLAGRLRGLQGAAVASGLTRVAGIGNGANAPLPLGFSAQGLSSDFAVMRLTANTDEVDALACEFADGALQAATGYNGATVMMTVIADDWRLASRGDCDVEWVGSSAQGVITLRLLFVAGAGVEETRLTTDYLIDIAETLARMGLDRFVKEIDADGFNWLRSDPDWDDDGVLNPYDWTPTSVTVLGMTVGVNLTLGGATGTADNPWPIYNVWQLQAIDGVSVSANGEMSVGLTLFGETESARLSRHYRLAVDIDATPTRDWGDSKEGFDPIGGEFAGGFDGGGYAVRGLFIDRPDQSEIGLFRIINSAHEITDLGVEEADIHGREVVGILAGRLRSDVGRIWTTGKVVGDDQGGGNNIIGGLAGSSAANAHDSWSTAEVRGASFVGGLIGQILGAGTVTLSDNWAAGDVNGLGFVGGFGGIVSGADLVVALFARNWSAGAVAGGGFTGGFLGGVFNSSTNTGAASVSLSYWNADTSGRYGFEIRLTAQASFCKLWARRISATTILGMSARAAIFRC